MQSPPWNLMLQELMSSCLTVVVPVLLLFRLVRAPFRAVTHLEYHIVREIRILVDRDRKVAKDFTSFLLWKILHRPLFFMDAFILKAFWTCSWR